MVRKLMLIGVVGLFASAAYAGLSDFGRNSNSNSYWARCDNGATRTVTDVNGMICTYDGNKNKCSRDWTPYDAANWACR